MTTANVNIKKVLLRRGNTTQNNNYTGVYGEVSVDMEAKTLRIHDGNVAGGYTVQGGGGGTLVVRSPFNSNASILTIAGGGGGVSNDNIANIMMAAGAITTNGNTGAGSPAPPAGGVGGNGTGSSNQTVQGGAGFFTNGYNVDGVSFNVNDVSKPRSFTNTSPLLGGYVYWSGTGASPGLPGGFGGGGGGGSYNSGTNQTNTSNVRLGNGMVTVTFVSSV